MAEETQQEKEARWAAYRLSNQTHQQNWKAKARARGRNLVIVGGVWLIVTVIVAFMLL